MLTVLPTPAPPNKPTLPPFAKGIIRSMTLTPVSSNSVEGLSSVNFGASRCITICSSVSIGPFSSIDSPSTFIMRPRLISWTENKLGKNPINEFLDSFDIGNSLWILDILKNIFSSSLAIFNIFSFISEFLLFNKNQFD